MARQGQRHRGRSFSRSRSSRPRSLHRLASRLDRSDFQNRRDERAGMNATNIAGHSVALGMATQAALNGSSERAIARTTRHRSRRVLRRYIRPGEMFRENASASLRPLSRKLRQFSRHCWSREISSYPGSKSFLVSSTPNPIQTAPTPSHQTQTTA